MARYQPADTDDGAVPVGLRRFLRFRALELAGLGLIGAAALTTVAIATWKASDPSLNHAVDSAPENFLGYPGAVIADQALHVLGLGSIAALAVLMAWAVRFLGHQSLERFWKRMIAGVFSIVFSAAALSSLPAPDSWALGPGLGGTLGDILSGTLISLVAPFLPGFLAAALAFMIFGLLAFWTFLGGTGIAREQVSHLVGAGLDRLRDMANGGVTSFEQYLQNRRERADERARLAKKKSKEPKEPGLLRRIAGLFSAPAAPKVVRQQLEPKFGKVKPLEPRLKLPPVEEVAEPEEEALDEPAEAEEPVDEAEEPIEDEAEIEEEAPPAPVARVLRNKKDIKPTHQKVLQRFEDFELPPLDLLAEPKRVNRGADISDEQLEANARALEGVLDDFGVKGQIINVRPGPVVTLYELEPAPGIKSSRVIGLADDIARSMSAISARVAVVPGRNAIGIELPNMKRETVFLRELLGSEAFAKTNQTLAMALGKNIGGEPVFADLARMPHLLIAGTTGSGKSVGINTMILSLLYRLPPERCKLIMIDPKMLELSVYEGIPHLLAPVVTDPRKAVVALKWAVREMEDRYRKMSKIGVRNIDGYNQKVKEAEAKGKGLTRTVQTGFDPQTGEPVFETEAMESESMPYIVVIIDEMADLMMVAGKDIEGAVQRLAQMARAAGIHVIMATQRPSVDVITGTIKANFPTRVSFQVTSKIDSRTILGEQGAEQLLGQGDMLYMAGGGRIGRLHGPFVKDDEVEKIVKHLKEQGQPAYLDAITEEDEEGEEGEYGAAPADGDIPSGSGDELYDQAVAVVLRDKKVSTSYIQRRLQVGYNKAASLIERMEKEGLISSSNAIGKREILVPGDSARD